MSWTFFASTRCCFIIFFTTARFSDFLQTVWIEDDLHLSSVSGSQEPVWQSALGNQNPNGEDQDWPPAPVDEGSDQDWVFPAGQGHADLVPGSAVAGDHLEDPDASQDIETEVSGGGDEDVDRRGLYIDDEFGDGSLVSRK